MPDDSVVVPSLHPLKGTSARASVVVAGRITPAHVQVDVTWDMGAMVELCQANLGQMVDLYEPEALFLVLTCSSQN